MLGSRKTSRIVREAGGQLLLTGVAQCRTCSGTFIKRSRSNQPMRYRCRNLASNKCSQGVTISADKLDTYVLEQIAPLANMPVIGSITEEDPDNALHRETLIMQIDDAMEAPGQETHDQVAVLAVKICRLKQSLSLIPVVTLQTRRHMGATFAELLHDSPELFFTHALEAVMVYPPITPRSHIVNSEHVRLIRRDTE